MASRRRAGRFGLTQRVHGSGLVSSVSVNHVSQRSLTSDIALQHTSQIHFSSSAKYFVSSQSRVSSRRVLM